MATTGQEVFNTAMALADQMSPNGTIDGSVLADYGARSINIINNVMHELVDTLENFKSQIYNDWTTAETFGEYSKLTLPTDYHRFVKIETVPETTDNVAFIDGNDLWILTEYTGQVKLLYKAIPTRITALTDTLTVSDTIANTVLVYGLIAKLFANSNAKIANYYEAKYTEERNNLRPKAIGRLVKQKDSYGRW